MSAQDQQAADRIAQGAKTAADAASRTAADAAKAAQNAAANPANAPRPDLGLLNEAQLRSRLEELKNQRQSLANRRDALSSSYENATGANQAGMASRLQMLDNNIVVYEAEIAAVGRELAIKASTRTSVPGDNRGGGIWREGDVAGAVFSTFLSTVLVTIFVMRRVARRRGWNRMANPAQPNMLASNERLERIENAVDTIAVEIERVSENQRFMTRLMTETQLGEQLNDVRKSTELAKSLSASGEPSA